RKFAELDKRPASEVEADTLKKWGGVKAIYDKTLNAHKDDPKFVFFDGPATANGYPGLHHMLAKFLKDSFTKYQTMQGKRVVRKVGWDTHGLPVELQVEKELGFNGKQDIEKYGIKEFNEKCKESVFKNKESFTELTSKMGQFIDIDNPYITYDNNYIETEWYILKEFYKKGLFYEGHKILPYCPRCGTGLASHEVAQGYKEDTVETVIVPMKKVDEDVYFLVWTTTPWTLIANVALCVHPNLTYVKVKSGYYKFILAESLVSKVLGEDVEILEKYKGTDLEYMEYEQLIPDLKVNGKAFYVTCDEYVTAEDGTGIVHMAPAFGEDDSRVGKKYNLPYLNPVGEDGKYIEGPWQGMLVFDADKEVISYLKANDKLFKKQKMIHNYPHCWRCDSPLIYYSKPSYYLKVTAIKDKIIKANKKVHWYPAYVGEKRFGNWLENMNDWAISRSRYWGTPLPYWTCECGHDEMIGSRKELVEKAIENIDETIDLHRPFVDEIHLKCPKCGKPMTRTKDVIDCWFDSGSMPFAQYHWPFANDGKFEDQFPADFICEGIDQTRGWFYTLIIISVFLKGVAPFKNVLVNDLIQDAEGKKMSKSKGNIVEPFTTMKEYGADVVRFYLPYVSPVWTPLRFDINGLKEVYSKFFNPLKNTYSFFALYANTDNIDIDKCKVPYAKREEIDKWLLSKYNKLLKYVTESYDEYDLNKVVKAVTEFVSEDLSNWYIRRNRKRFWASELDNSKKAVYITTYEVLEGLCRMIAPVVPFITDEIYTKLTGEESVHLASFPKYKKQLIDEHIEQRMDLIRSLISIGRYVREETKIKVRQPLSEALLDGKNKELISDLVSLIEEELNIKKVVFVDDLNEYMNLSVKPNFKVVGKIFGPLIKEFQTKLETLSSEEINNLQKGQSIKMTIGSEEKEITPEMVDIRISSKEGFNVGMENNNFIILDTTLTDDLILEGIAREMISKVQQIRKNKDFNVADRITLYYNGDEDIDKCIAKFSDYIKNETLSLEIVKNDNLQEKYDLNG
ncbi:MAG TPA: isoleucine--tRNA ligase, partial [Candidatus Coprovivens excrementavium]|nr:isoleucine--tRNA ligase [Candidatus Coprovivens excrementavium]